MNRNVMRNITPPYRGGVVTLRHCYGCYVTVTLLVSYVCSLWGSVTAKWLSVTPGVLRFFGQDIPGQGGQSVHFGLASKNLRKPKVFPSKTVE